MSDSVHHVHHGTRKDRDTANHTYNYFILQNSNAVISAGYSVQYIDTPPTHPTYTQWLQIKGHNIIQEATTESSAMFNTVALFVNSCT